MFMAKFGPQHLILVIINGLIICLATLFETAYNVIKVKQTFEYQLIGDKINVIRLMLMMIII